MSSDVPSTTVTTQTGAEQPTVAEIMAASPKRKTNTGYSHKGRSMARSVDPFGQPLDILKQGILKAQAGFNEPEDESNPSTHTYWSYLALCELVVGLDALVAEKYMDIVLLSDIAEKLSRARRVGRGEDTSALKTSIGSMLTVLGLVDTSEPPFPNSDNKASRGWVHPASARLNCPAEWQAHLNPSVIDEIRAMKKTVSGNEFPAFMYADSQCNNTNDLENGLCRGQLLVRAFKRIWISPSSAMSEKGISKTRRKGAARIYGLTAVTPRAIAYAVIQTRFALSSTETWGDNDGTVDLCQLYWNVVELFTDNGLWAQETLAWWNEQIFGNRTGTNPHLDAQHSRSTAANSMASKLAEQRANKRRVALASAIAAGEGGASAE